MLPNDPNFYDLACEINKGKPNPYEKATKKTLFNIHQKQIEIAKTKYNNLVIPKEIKTTDDINHIRESMNAMPILLLNITYNLHLLNEANTKNNIGYTVDDLINHDQTLIMNNLFTLIQRIQSSIKELIYKQKKYLNIDNKLINTETLIKYGELLPEKLYNLFMSNLKENTKYRLIFGINTLIVDGLDEATTYGMKTLSGNEIKKLQNFLLKAAD